MHDDADTDSPGGDQPDLLPGKRSRGGGSNHRSAGLYHQDPLALCQRPPGPNCSLQRASIARRRRSQASATLQKRFAITGSRPELMWRSPMTQISTLGRSNDLRGSLPWQNRPRMENRELGGAMECSGAPMLFRRHAEIYGEGEPADYLYKVVTGVVRTYKVLADVRRQVGGFCLPGDIFGLEIDAEHAFSAETISECRVLVAKHSTLIARAKTDHEVAFQLWMLTGRELRRLQDHLLLLIKNAP